MGQGCVSTLSIKERALYYLGVTHSFRCPPPNKHQGPAGARPPPFSYLFESPISQFQLELLDHRAAITGRVRKHTRLPLPPEGQAASHLSYLFERGHVTSPLAALQWRRFEHLSMAARWSRVRQAHPPIIAFSGCLSRLD